MTLILEIPNETENRLRSIANARGQSLEAFALTQLEKSATDDNARTLSPMEKAVAHIKANPIQSLGPVDAAADLEEVRAGRMAELAR